MAQSEPAPTKRSWQDLRPAGLGRLRLEVLRDGDARGPVGASASFDTPRSVKSHVSSLSGATTYGDTVPSLSAVTSATTSAEASTIARFTYDSSRSSVVTPNVGSSVHTPGSRGPPGSGAPPRWSPRPLRPADPCACARPAGPPPPAGAPRARWRREELLVTTVASRSRGRWRATATLVVPLSMNTT